jgi:LacI family transcriptional regulator
VPDVPICPLECLARLVPLSYHDPGESAYRQLSHSPPQTHVSVTIYDIAERAGVSIATVSRVFSGRARVAERTRDRVFTVARQLGYEPNASARSLARQSTQIISAVLPMMTSYFFMEVIRGVQDCLSQANYDLLVFASRSPGDVSAQFDRALQPGRADGLILCSTPLDPERAAHLTESSNPVVLLDGFHPDFDSVSVNNFEGGFAAVKHLVQSGCSRIGLILPHPDSLPGIERQKGALGALAQAGLDLDPALVAVSDETLQHGYTREAGYSAMKDLLARSPRPDAVFAASDVQALGALKAIRDAGLRCPDDMALIGFDDIRTSAYVGLSTLSQPMHEMGKTAAGKLLQRIERPTRPVSHTVFSARLMARDTTLQHRFNPAPAGGSPTHTAVSS